ncbi:MAG: excinuclease ABC subunit UvrA [Candidatus Dadabacteria bacterium]|nr:excinuclease ABC subunit UvrA [Candidatus Dadabacteria bacterium]|tara:strand:- start:22376 stop:25120 length:2745 start_codon:yes stop_codon:yes gene_type:complete
MIKNVVGINLMKQKISVTGAKNNNLKNIDAQIPWHSLCVITGLSGSGKSTLALETIHGESRRRYLESLSTYARQFLEKIDKPEIDNIEGLPPSIAIESRNKIKNSRSTVGTMTEVYDYLRIIYSKIGEIFCPQCKVKCENLSNNQIYENLWSDHKGKVIHICGKNEKNIKERELKKIGIFEYLENGQSILLKSDPNKIIPFPIFDTIKINKDNKSRIIESIEFCYSIFKTITIFEKQSSTESKDYKKEFCCTKCNKEYSKLSSNKFSFNSPDGACKDCKGFGNNLLPDFNLIVDDESKSINEGCISFLERPSLSFAKRKFIEFCVNSKIDLNKKFSDFSKSELDKMMTGNEKYKGIIGIFKRLESKSYKMHIRVLLSRYRSAKECLKCNGSKIGTLASNVKIHGMTIKQLCDLNIKDLNIFFKKLKINSSSDAIIKEPLKQVKSRLKYLLEVGLDYLTLSRLSKTLSGGEAQRVNLAQQLGSELTDTLYVLDEPSIGLHQKDIEKLFNTIQGLKNLDNTIILIEHDLDMISKADWVIELGPGSGYQGGDIIHCGSLEKLKRNSQSLTSSYLNGKQSIKIPSKRRTSSKKISILGAKKNNIDNIDFNIPLNSITCITGVSGSGKSTLIYDCFYGNAIRKMGSSFENPGFVKKIEGLENIKEIIMMTQEPIGKTARSNPATYLKIYDEIRTLMSSTPEAKSFSLKPGDFSFNTPGGRCEECKGEGRIVVEMQFLSDVEVLCDFCNGLKFKEEILKIRYNNKNISEILNMTISEALLFFEGKNKIKRLLEILQSVGLGYLKLGQSSNTLSGGESQRIKIAKFLSSSNSSDVLFILDEPSVGLHVDDLKSLINTFNNVIERGNTILLIEHNTDLIKISDFIIDLGPEGGINGGKILAQGTPEQIIKDKNSIIGPYLNI